MEQGGLDVKGGWDAHGAHVSYLANKGDDLGRPIVLHKPLNKGQHTQASLCKVFDEPGMQPKKWIPDAPRRTFTQLSTQDIDGATPKPKNIPGCARGANPLQPEYQLASFTGSDAVSASIQRAATVRDHINIRDIEGARPKPLPQPSGTSQLDITDIEGSKPGWKPHFRAHVGVNLRDPGLDVSDINSYMPKKKVTCRHPDDPWVWTTGTLPDTDAHVPAKQTHQGNVQHTGRSNTMEFTGLPVFQMTSAAEQPAATPHAQSADELATSIACRQQGYFRGVGDRVTSAQKARKQLQTPKAHDLRVSIASEKLQCRQVADQVINSLQVTRDNVTHVWQAMTQRDREAAGKLTVQEFVQAVEASHMDVSSQQMEQLVHGLRDDAGLVSYRDFAKVLLHKAKNPSFVHHSVPTSSAKGCNVTSTRIPGQAQHQAASASVAPDTMPASSPMTAWSEPAYKISTDIAPRRTCPDDASQPHPPAQLSRSSSLPRAPNTAATGMSPSADYPPTTYYPFKSTPYWFSGSTSKEEGASAAAAYSAKQDGSHNATLQAAHHPDCWDSSEAAALAMTSPSKIPDTPTISSKLKTGLMTAEELQTHLQQKHSKTSLDLLASTRSGNSLGSVLKGSLGQMAKDLASSGPQNGPQRPQSGVPTSANRAAAGAVARPKSAIAPLGSVPAPQTRGMGIRRLERQILSEAISAVRSLS